MTSAYSEILKRIEAAIVDARAIFSRFTPGAIDAEFKAGHDPVTEADRAIDAVLRQNLLREGEGWLSEESVDDFSRLEKSNVWVVDPLDGTREFVKGIPEFCVSIGYVENGRPAAGGIHNPATQETFVGAIDTGVFYNGKPVSASPRKDLQGAVTLASRSEVKRGEWKPFANGPLEVRAMGSVAYKLALVSAGLADITFSLTPKNEWDVAAGHAQNPIAHLDTAGLRRAARGNRSDDRRRREVQRHVRAANPNRQRHVTRRLPRRGRSMVQTSPGR